MFRCRTFRENDSTGCYGVTDVRGSNVGTIGINQIGVHRDVQRPAPPLVTVRKGGSVTDEGSKKGIIQKELRVDQ